MARYRDAPQVGRVSCADQDGVWPQVGEGEPFRRESGSTAEVCEWSDAKQVMDQIRIAKYKRDDGNRADGEHASPIAFNDAPFAADKMAKGEEPDADI